MEEIAKDYLFRLCNFGEHRRLGSIWNKQATDYFYQNVKEFGFEIILDDFKCLDHKINSVVLTTGDTRINVQGSPFTLPCDVTSELVIARNIEELEKVEAAGRLLLMKDDLCKEQLMPKNFRFYNPDHHKQIISIIEQKKPAAIITATGKDLQMVGNLYPFNVIEDGDFNIPVVTTKDIIGDELVKLKGKEFTLKIDAERIPSSAHNVILRKNPDGMKKLVIMAHIDSKGGTPGASDNASGTVVLMLLAELLKDFEPPGDLCLEIIAMNGEDNYSVAGEMDYLKRYGDRMEDMVLVINIDDVGHGDGKHSFSFYEVPEGIKGPIVKIIEKNEHSIEGDPWYAGDHMIFVQAGVPAIAITSEHCWDLMATITHTPDDVPENIRPAALVELAIALKEVVSGLVF